MNRNVDILNELNEISALVARIGNANVFTVPSHYFDTVADTVLACVNEEINSLSSAEKNDIPAGYFNHLPAAILTRIEGTAANELQEISPLLADLPKVNPFLAPENYFSQLPSAILLQVSEDISDTLLTARSLQPFEVPQDYFENLSTEILSKVQKEAGAKVIAMPKRRSLVLKLAAAAVFTGALVLGVFKFTNNHPSIIVDKGQVTATIDPVIKKGMTIAADEKKFDETLGNLDEESIAKYLEKNGSESDVAVLTAELDEDNLPDQDEYLTDEKTLDNFIEDISTKN